MRNVPVLLAYTVHGDLEEAERRVSLLDDVINRWYGDAPSLCIDKLAVRMSTLLFELRCALSRVSSRIKCLPGSLDSVAQDAYTVVLYAHQLRHIVLSRITALFCSRARRSLVALFEVLCLSCDRTFAYINAYQPEASHV